MAVWVAAFIADWAAFRVWVPVEAVIPAVTLFLFASLLSAPRNQFFAAGLFAAATLGFVLVHRAARQQASAAWLPSQVRGGTNAMLSTGAGLIGLAVVGATFVAPLVPGAESRGLIDYLDGGSEPAPRVILNPLVSVAARLNQQPDVEMFIVESDRRSYWRETSLELFDGTEWKPSLTLEEATADLPQSIEPDGEFETVTQRYTIGRLGGKLMPAAYRPVAVSEERYPRLWEAESSTLAIGGDSELAEGDTYTVESQLPSLDPDILRTASPAVPDAIADVYLALPDGFPERIVTEAQNVVAGHDTAYDRARALQDYFHTDRFDYDKGVEPKSGTTALESFLFENRRGFCQQFAATYAAMARAIGLPARVATGFTWGEEDAARPGVYHVRGSNAHAWPEVYLGEFGWVLFEPTPGRAIPGGESYTGIPDDRAVEEGPGSATIAVPSGFEDPFEGEIPDDTIPDEPEAAGRGSIEDTGGLWSTVGRWAVRALGLGLVVCAAIAASLVVTAAGRAIHRRRRRRKASAPGDRVRVAWTESVEAAEMRGVIWRPWETPTEFARRSRTAVDVGRLAELADVLAAADYSADGATDDDARRARGLADHIRRDARQRATREQRLRARFDPRPPQRWPAARRSSGPTGDDASQSGAGNVPAVAVLERSDSLDI
jgi:transglutaminase-like putative cysteine protease